jgi:hypothetical protein
MNGDIHQPAFLKISWGNMLWRGGHFDCRLASLDIVYSLFNRNGEPLRAQLNTKFIEDLSVKKRLAIENKNSPDLTHTRIIEDGTNLPLWSNRIYNDPLLYIEIARANKLDHFRSLKPGSEIIFPPIDNHEIESYE